MWLIFLPSFFTFFFGFFFILFVFVSSVVQSAGFVCPISPVCNESHWLFKLAGYLSSWPNWPIDTAALNLKIWSQYVLSTDLSSFTNLSNSGVKLHTRIQSAKHFSIRHLRNGRPNFDAQISSSCVCLWLVFFVLGNQSLCPGIPGICRLHLLTSPSFALTWMFVCVDSISPLKLVCMLIGPVDCLSVFCFCHNEIVSCFTCFQLNFRILFLSSFCLRMFQSSLIQSSQLLSFSNLFWKVFLPYRDQFLQLFVRSTSHAFI